MCIATTVVQLHVSFVSEFFQEKMDHSLVLQKCHTFLMGNIDKVNSIVDFMIQQEALTLPMAEDIKVITIWFRSSLSSLS